MLTRKFALLLALVSGPVMASPITSFQGFWSTWYHDTEVRCGDIECALTDEIGRAANRLFALEGTTSLTRVAQSGGAYAGLSLTGVGHITETEGVFDYQLSVARTLYAGVAADAPSAAYAFAAANLNGHILFELSEAALYTGTSFLAYEPYNNIRIETGTILGPGRYFIGDLSTPFVFDGGPTPTTGIMRAGQQSFVSDVSTISFRLERVQVPEPGTLALLGAGLFGLAAARRRRC